MTELRTEVVDTTHGKPAAGVAVELQRRTAGLVWHYLGDGVTDEAGRVDGFTEEGHAIEAGMYRLVYATGDFFTAAGLRSALPHITVDFDVDGRRDVTVRLGIDPFGYSVQIA